MCVGAIIHARIKKVFFSASDPKSGFLVGKEAILSSNLLNHKFTYEGGLLEKESSDLLFHLFVLWKSLNIIPEEIMEELKNRETMSGHEEKASRKN